jgi:hypothetical protein
VNPNANLIATLTSLEESLWRAETRGNRVLMEATFADDVFEFGRSGRIWQRNDMLFDRCKPIAATLPLPNLRIILLNDVTALVTYDSIVTYDTIEHARRSSVWSLENNHWRLRFHQGTPYEPDARKEI